jgi:DNA-binding CsgD family transcriptional regulator
MTHLANPGTASVSSAILGCDDLAAVPAQVLDPLRRLLDAQGAVFLQFRHDAHGNPVVGESAYIGPHPESVREYAAGRFTEDPIFRPVMESAALWHGAADPLLCHLRGSVASRALETSRYFRTFMRPHEFGDVIAMVIPIELDGPQMICIGIHRALGKPAFEAVHGAALGSIARPLKLALRGVCADAALAERRAVLTTLTERDQGPEYAVFDQHVRLLGSSRGLGALLSPGGAHAPEAFATVGAAIRELRASERAASEVALPNGRRAELAAAVAGTGARYVLTLGNAPRAAAPAPAPPDAELGVLTGRERDVAVWVSRGLRNVQVAAELGISVRTVENHLRAIYDKLGVRSRAELVARLLCHRNS